MIPSIAVVSSPARPDARWNTASDWITGFAALALWLITRPYRGVRHDAILYTGQVLDRLMPDRLGNDLFFQYGSQDKYSLFSPLMAPLVSRFGIGSLETVVLVVCHVGFMLACWRLTEGWFARPLRWASMLLLAVLPHTYGGLGAFSYAEPFLTARSVAEPFALFALWQLQRGRIAVAIGLGVVASAFHPLITLPILVVGWITLVLQRRAWLWLGLGLLVPIALGTLGITPFDGFLRQFDPAWYAVVRDSNANAFVGSYTVLDWAPIAFDALVLVLYVRADDAVPALRRLILATLIATTSLTLLWAIGADWLHDVFLTQIQLWRVYWPMHLLAVLVMASVFLRCWERGWVGRWCAAALGIAALAVMSNWKTGWLCVLWALGALAADHWNAKVSKGTAMAAVAGSVAMMLTITFKVLRTTLDAVAHSPDNFDDVTTSMIVLGLPLVGALLAIGVLWMAKLDRRAQSLAAIAVVVGLCFGVTMWDQRSPWQRRLEADATAHPPVFDAEIPVHASVYWENDLVTPWLLARRGNFFSTYQGAGLLFNRQTALEFKAREDATAPFEIERELCLTIHALTTAPDAPPSDCAVSPEAAAQVCRNKLHPDYLVFKSPMSVPPLATWHQDIEGAGRERNAFYLYACTSFR